MSEIERPDSKKIDRRSQRTRAALSQGLISLLENTEFRKITVNDICTAANVSRPTFYTYYEDKFTLLYHCIDTFFNEVFHHTVEEGLSEKELIDKIIENLSRHKMFLANCLFPGMYKGPTSPLAYNGSHLAKESLPSEVLNYYRIGGAIMVFCWWSMHGNTMSRMQLVEQLVSMLEHGKNYSFPV
jgi:AcrR family transcriptional regulator